MFPLPRGEGQGEGMSGTHLIKLARQLRRNQTDAEKILWKHLRARQLCGLKFRRQHQIGNYIVDFVCLEKSIIIEVDGGQHSENEKDKERDKWLEEEEEGFTVLRFWNNEVMKNIEGVLEKIRMHCFKHPPLNPLKGGER